MFRPNPAIIRFSSERVSVFIRSVRLCNDGQISSSVVLIITIIQTVAGGGVTRDKDISLKVANIHLYYVHTLYSFPLYIFL